MNQDEQLKQALGGMIGLYRDVIHSIAVTEQRLERLRALLDLTIAHMVDHTGNADQVATLIGQPTSYVTDAVNCSSVHA